MKTIRNLFIGMIGTILLAATGFAQTATTQTTLSAAMTNGDQTITLASSTGVSAAGFNNQVVTGLYIDREYITVSANVNAAGTGNVWTVKRGVGGIRSAHLSGAFVWVGPPATFDLGPNDRVGSCTRTNFAYLPLIEVRSGTLLDCDGNNKWSPYGVGAFYVPPTQCTFAPTTLTVTNTYPQIGASNIFVLKGISNAAAGTMTLTCNILVPTAVQALRGAILTDITLFIASSATGSGVVPTSVGTATLGSITFPAAATTETASTVTPVAIGGTVTTTGAGASAFLAAVTTDGSFYTMKHTFSTVVDLSKDLTILQYTMPILQSAASVSTLFTPGLMVHYRKALEQ
jgi:hypothetical protein